MKVAIVFSLFCFVILTYAQETVDRRIVNGQEANVEDFPHVLSLLDLGRYICGASVIGKYFALSAGD